MRNIFLPKAYSIINWLIVILIVVGLAVLSGTVLADGDKDKDTKRKDGTKTETKG